MIATFLIGVWLPFSGLFGNSETPADSWFKLFLGLFIPRISAAAVASVGLFVIFFYKYKGKRILIITTYILAVAIVGLLLTPTPIWKTRIVKFPSNTINLSYTYRPYRIVSSPQVDVSFSIRAEKSDILDFYIKSFDEQGLCLGMQSNRPEERCFSSDILKDQLLKQGSEDWTVNYKKEGGGLNAAYFAIGDNEDGLTIYVSAFVY